jgi:hypothetical protein
MGITAKISSTSSGLIGKISSSEPTMTIKNSIVATTVSSLSDVDQSKAEGKQAGAVLVYDPVTESFKSEQVFTYDGDNVGLDGGNF